MMFTSSDHYSSSMPMAPLITTKWKYNNIEVAPNCPRCASSNTKFCYYNNYSLSQPRYFCKACRRYWTKGGSLRNVPVGGGCRKSRRARAAGRQSTSSYADAAPAASTAEGSNGGGACIDMAAVFAKYVNQNAEVEESFSTGSSSDNVQGSCTFDVDSRLEEITTTFEYQKPLGNLMNDQMMMPQMSTCQDVSSHDQQFVYQDCNGLELLQQQGVLCDHPDILWSEGTTHVPNYGLQQPMVQVEDCGVFAADNDDQLRFSANLVTDNWAAFDLSAYDFYSTP